MIKSSGSPYKLGFLLSAINLLLLYCNIQGQSLDMDTIYVQTTRLPLTVEETGRNITIIKGEDIQTMSFTSLDDLLQYVPGIEVQTRGAFGVQGDISMRGATFSQVQVLVNGMKLNDPLTGHFNSNIPITPTEIQRIEVLRGSAAAMYGADAVGGVINVITKSFDQSDNTRNKISGKMNYGAHELVSAEHGFHSQKENYYIGGGLNLQQSNGQKIEERIVNDATLSEYNSFFDIKTAGLSLGYKINSDWELHGRTAYDDRFFDARFFYTNSTFDKSVETTKNWWNQVQLTNKGVHTSTDVKMAYRKGTDKFVFSPDFSSTNEHTTHFWNINIDHSRIVSESFVINVGGQVDRREVASTDRGDHNDKHYGVYLMSVLRPASSINLNTSLRLDHDDNFGLQFTPQVNFAFLFSKGVLRASMGKSIRAADYTERYVSYNLEDLTPGRNLGNPNLTAESAWSEEIGINYNVTDFWQLKTTAFARQSNNLIDFVITNESDILNNDNLLSGEDYFYATNITSVSTKGLELESWVRKKIKSDISFQWSLGYAFLNTSNNEDLVSVYIASHASHLLNTNFVLSSKRFNIASNMLYKVRDERSAISIDANLSPSYQLWNLNAGYNITSHIEVNLQVHNLFDANYQNVLGAAMPNRWIMGGFKYSL